MYQAPAAPQTVGETLDSGFALYRDSLKDTFALALLSGLVTAPFSRLAQSMLSADVTFGNAVTQVLISLASMAVTLFFYGAIIARIDAVHAGGRMPFGESLDVAWRRFPVMFGSFVLFVIAFIVGLVLFVVPGVYLMIALGFVLFAAILERKGVVESLLYSHLLVKGHWWRTAALLVIIGVVAVVLYLALGIVFGIAMTIGGGGVNLVPGAPLPWYFDFVVTPLISSVVVPLTCALFIAVYADLKLRREGANIAEGLGSAEA